MVQEEPDVFREFSKAFDRWQWLLPPVGDLRDSNRPGYSIELELDHEVSSLATVGGRALKGDTTPDWPKIVPEYLADLDAIERKVDAAPIPDERKQMYRDYISECRSVWEKIALLPVPVDGHLGFRKEVLSSFRVLEETYGFRVTETTPIRVRYESSNFLVELRHSPQCPEIGFELGKRDNLEEHDVRFSLDDIMYWAGLGIRFNYAQFNLETQGGVANFIANAASLFRNYSDILLRDDASGYASLAAKRVEREQRISESEE